MNRLFLFLMLLLGQQSIYGQTYTDYLGAGHNMNVQVRTSSNSSNTHGNNSVSGKGLDAEMMDVSRFLAQATMGADRSYIETLDATLASYEQWIDEQMLVNYESMQQVVTDVWDETYQLRINAGVDPNDIFGPYALHFHYGWWQNNMTNQDLLRQKVAYALSQILVVSSNSDLRDRPIGMAHYYDILVNNAFGNYQDILRQVSQHVVMGYYLSHFNNPKTDLANNIHPDENYAREIMQLFSIGLYQLNNDGTYILDSNGDPIPTYDNNDVKELAKVFTGLGPGAINSNVTWTNTPYFGLGLWGTDATVPMAMYENWHEQGTKTIIDGYVIPAGQTGLEDITMAIDYLFNHPNVGPFLSKRLIQRLVKSNPTSGYVNRVANAFNDNGQGVRGDMAAVIKAILLDDEARSCDNIEDPTASRLREPLMRYMHVARALPVDSPYGRFWNNGFNFLDDAKQMIMYSPTVFNFYPTDHQPVGEIANNGLVAPEFKLHNTASSIGMINSINAWTIWDGLMYSWEGNYGDVTVSLETSDLESKAEEVEELINEYDILFTHGQLSEETRQVIRDAITPLIWGNYQYDRTRLSLYLMLLSPDYAITR